MTAPEQLRHQLELHRAAGQPFDIAWRRALKVAINGQESAFWASTFRSQREVWAANYAGGSCAGNRLFTTEREPTRYAVARLVA